MQGRVLVGRGRIRNCVRRLAGRLSRDYAGRKPVLLCVLKGAFVFAADLARAMTVPVDCEFVSAGSYGNGRASSGRVRFGPFPPLKGRDVVIVDTVLDTGQTLAAIRRRLKGCRSVTACVLAAKRPVRAPVDYLGLEIPDRFVVGYGLDDAGRHRNLPDLRAI